MPLELHSSCKARLCEELTKILATVVVEHGVSLRTDIFEALLSLDKVLPSDRKFRERISSYLGDYPFLEFVYPWLQSAIRSKQNYESEANSKRLTEISGFEDLGTVSKSIINSFESLPWSYLISFPLPSFASSALDALPLPFAIGSAITIVAADKKLQSDFLSANQKIPRLNWRMFYLA